MGTAPIDFIPTGALLEVQEDLDPMKVWLVRILENVGGRLLLRYEGAQHADKDFWLFYLCPRLHQVGWASDSGMQYEVPQGKELFKTDSSHSCVLLSCLAFSSCNLYIQ